MKGEKQRKLSLIWPNRTSLSRTKRSCILLISIGLNNGWHSLQGNLFINELLYRDGKVPDKISNGHIYKKYFVYG